MCEFAELLWVLRGLLALEAALLSLKSLNFTYSFLYIIKALYGTLYPQW